MKKKLLFTILVLIMCSPLAASGDYGKKDNPRISFDFVDADLKNVLKVLAEVSSKNIVVSEDVKGRVTMRIDNITWEEAFDVILKNNDLGKIEEENILRVVSLKKYFDERERDRKERLELLREKEIKQRLEEDFVTETIFINYVDAIEIEKIVRGQTAQPGQPGAPATASKGLLTPFGAVTLVKWTNSLIVKDVKENVEQIKLRIREHDVAPAQVQIEARIVEANSDFSRELGIKWGATYKTGSNVIGGTVSAPTLPFPAAGTLSVLIGAPTDSFQLNATLSAMEVDGRGKIIANPKVVTSDNQPAKISQGTQIPYQTVSLNGTQTQFIDAVLSLEVVPHVTKDGNVNMKIKATKDRPTQILGSPIPGVDKKEATTIVLVKDGETAVIGGIYESEREDREEGVPLLNKIPIVNWIFGYSKKQLIKKELLIFVTPSIIKNKYAEAGVGK
jgi:type IV pilus assembly protein PilQ